MADAAAGIGTPFFRRYAGLLDAPRVRRSPFVLALGVCLGLAAAAEQVGLAALVGAFLAGMVLADARSIAEPGLTVPHPELTNREFWLRELTALRSARVG